MLFNFAATIGLSQLSGFLSQKSSNIWIDSAVFLRGISCISLNFWELKPGFVRDRKILKINLVRMISGIQWNLNFSLRI